MNFRNKADGISLLCKIIDDNKDSIAVQWGDQPGSC